MKTKFTLMIATVIAITTGSLQKVNAQAWKLTGNAGATPPTNFIGTTGNKLLLFKTQSKERMRIGRRFSTLSFSCRQQKSTLTP